MDRQSFVRPDVPAPSRGEATRQRGGVPAARVPDARRAHGEGPPVDDAELTVLVVDADPHRREVLARSLTTVGAGRVHEATSAREARARADAPCGLVVVDLDLPDGDALDLVGDLAARGRRTVVVGGAADPAVVREAFRSGAMAYLRGPGTGVDPAVGVVEPGRARPVPAAGGNRVLGVGGDLGELSRREVQVLQAVADGQSNVEVGAALELSALTVKSHLSRIGRKLGTGDRAQMVALAMRAGVIR